MAHLLSTCKCTQKNASISRRPISLGPTVVCSHVWLQKLHLTLRILQSIYLLAFGENRPYVHAQRGKRRWGHIPTCICPLDFNSNPHPGSWTVAVGQDLCPKRKTQTCLSHTPVSFFFLVLSIPASRPSRIVGRKVNSDPRPNLDCEWLFAHFLRKSAERESR